MSLMQPDLICVRHSRTSTDLSQEGVSSEGCCPGDFYSRHPSRSLSTDRVRDIYARPIDRKKFRIVVHVLKLWFRTSELDRMSRIKLVKSCCSPSGRLSFDAGTSACLSASISVSSLLMMSLFSLRSLLVTQVSSSLLELSIVISCCFSSISTYCGTNTHMSEV